jgi:hypothetical protein
MIEISISRDLADAHPEFMAHCVDRGRAISVFDSDGSADRSHETAEAAHLASDHVAGGLDGRWNAGHREPNGLRSWRPGAGRP